MIEELAATKRLLVATDFDGTLAEIVEGPDLATPLARSKAVVEDLRRRASMIERIEVGRGQADRRVDRFGRGQGCRSPRVQTRIRCRPGAVHG